MSKPERPAKVLILGLDGVTFDLIKPWAEAGHLPALAHLMEQGSHAPLASTMPPVTSPAWPSFMTGKNPGQHGVFDFIRPRAGAFGLRARAAPYPVDQARGWRIPAILIACLT